MFMFICRHKCLNLDLTHGFMQLYARGSAASGVIT